MFQDTQHTLPRVAVGACLVSLVLMASNALPLWAARRRVAPPARPAAERSTRQVGDAAIAPARPAASGGILLKGGLLSVNLREQELRAVLEDIAAQGDIDIRHVDGLPAKRVSLRFDDMPLVEGLKRLFRVADLNGYALITKTRGGQVQVQRIVFLAAEEGVSNARLASRPPRSVPQPRAPSGQAVTPPEPSPSTEEKTNGETAEESGSVFDEIKRNTTARRLLSQLVHPNEQVRERALERLIQTVSDDAKQAELLEFLEPLMEQLASENKEDRDEARGEIRKLLRR
jgi:hypothetical protein